eukprot:604677-Pleurochrysis_carterae.AAC.3
MITALGCNALLFANGGSGEWVPTMVMLHYSTPTAALAACLLSDARGWRFKTNRTSRLELSIATKFAHSRRSPSIAPVLDDPEEIEKSKERAQKLWRKAKLFASAGAAKDKYEEDVGITALDKPWRLLGIYGVLPKGNGLVFTANS